MDTEFHPKGFWLTVNRACNLRCTWCYAKGTNFVRETMELPLAKEIVGFMVQQDCRSAIIIGGEPTLYKDLGKLLSFCHGKGLKASIVTNGLKLANKKYLDSLLENNAEAVAISIKGSTERNFKKQTGRFGFRTTLDGILAAKKKGLRVSLSAVLSESMRAKELIDLAKKLDGIGQEGFLINSCNPSVTCNSVNADSALELNLVAADYMKIAAATAGLKMKIFFSMSIPFCLFPADFIAGLKKENRLYSGCQLVRREGVVFDTDGQVLICNSLFDFPVSTFQAISKTTQDYRNFWNSEAMDKVYRSFFRYPVNQCSDCRDWLECGGGCPLKWLVHLPSQYKLGERRNLWKR